MPGLPARRARRAPRESDAPRGDTDLSAELLSLVRLPRRSEGGRGCARGAVRGRGGAGRSRWGSGRGRRPPAELDFATTHSHAQPFRAAAAGGRAAGECKGSERQEACYLPSGRRRRQCGRGRRERRTQRPANSGSTLGCSSDSPAFLVSCALRATRDAQAR